MSIQAKALYLKQLKDKDFTKEEFDVWLQEHKIDFISWDDFVKVKNNVEIKDIVR